jgi:hypothetical protein
MDTRVLSPEVYAQLAGQFGEDIAAQLNQRRFAPLSHDEGQTVPYTRVFPSADAENQLDRPVLYVPGFTEGEVAKAPFAAALAEQGATVILPGQNRSKIVRDAVMGRNATCAAARNMLSVMECEGLMDGGVDVVTHSYGSLIFEAMTTLTRAQGRSTFEDSRVVMFRPA